MCEQVMPFLWAHRAEVIPIVVIALSSMVNRLTPHQDNQPKALWWLGSLVDMLSVLQTKGASTLLKAPLMQSEKPARDKTSTDRSTDEAPIESASTK